MAKKKKFRRVIKWGKWNPKLNGKELIIWGLLMMIPGINILSGFMFILAGVSHREVYWEEVK